MRAPVLLLALAIAATPVAAQDLGSESERAAGKVLYDKYCSQCHGIDGDGQGVAAVHLRPLPRDFTSAKFKIRTTPSGYVPSHEDLKNIIRRGMPYTSMPPWPQFTDEELSQLAYYVKTFSSDFENADNYGDSLVIGTAPPKTAETIEMGRQVYEESGCIRCHGELGRGGGTSATTLVDEWGQPIRPADLSQKWTFRGGATREDIFRTFSTGLNGSPMPSYVDALTEEQRWAMTDYVDSLSGGDDPGYATLVTARYVDDVIDIESGLEIFDAAPMARFPLVGQIMEPGRSFHPPAVSLEARAVYDDQKIAILVRWNDLSAETTGHNDPSLVVPREEDDLPDPGGAAPDEAEDEGGFWGDEIEEDEGDFWGDEAVDESAGSEDDFWGEDDDSADTAGAATGSEFSDAVALQFPVSLPTGAQKPYFLFGDGQNPVDLWFQDLAKDEPSQFLGRGSDNVTPNDSGEITTFAGYDNGQWWVVFERPLRSSSGVTFPQGGFVPIAFSMWDGLTRERGNKRALTPWYHLYLEPEVVESPVGPMVRTAALVLLFEIVAIVWIRRRQRTDTENTRRDEPRGGMKQSPSPASPE